MFATQALRGLAGENGLAAAQGLGMMDPERMAAMGGGAIAGMTLLGSAVSGAILGGLAGASWQAAGNGALFSVGFSGLAGAFALGMGGFGGAAAVSGVLGAAGLGFGFYRWNKMRKGTKLKGFLAGTGKRSRRSKRRR